jgi:uncharacterized protein YwqG
VARSFSIGFKAVQDPITALVTKFGGQPVWLGEPEWPTSRSTGQQMQFIGQIALEQELFGDIPSQMAYLFMADEDDVDNTFEAEGGENAVILQPGVPTTPVCPLAVGPTVQTILDTAPLRMSVAWEYAAILTPRDEPDFTDQGVLWTNWDSQAREAYWDAVKGNKIGGTPGFLQGDEFPGPGTWQLLLQLDSTKVPFDINFGDAGIGYAFIAGDGRIAKFLWQCA